MLDSNDDGVKDTNQKINQAIKSKFGNSIDKLNPKQMHVLNQHHLYTPKQWLTKIDKDYHKSIKVSKQEIKQHTEHLDKSIMANMGHNPVDVNAIKHYKQQIKTSHLKHKYLPQPVREKNGYSLLQKDEFNFKPASLDSINQIPQDIKVTKQVSHNISGSASHKRYMKIKHNPKLLEAHRKNVRHFDNTLSHRLGNKRWRIKKSMKKPNSKWHKYTEQGLNPKQVFNKLGIATVGQYLKKQTETKEAMNEAGIKAPSGVKHSNHKLQASGFHPKEHQAKQEQSVSHSQVINHNRGMQL